MNYGKILGLPRSTPLKPGLNSDAPSRQIGISCSTNDTRHVNLVTNSVISHEQGKDRGKCLRQVEHICENKTASPSAQCGFNEIEEHVNNKMLYIIDASCQ